MHTASGSMEKEDLLGSFLVGAPAPFTSKCRGVHLSYRDSSIYCNSKAFSVVVLRKLDAAEAGAAEGARVLGC